MACCILFAYLIGLIFKPFRKQREADTNRSLPPAPTRPAPTAVA
jgi:hypothetical protein